MVMATRKRTRRTQRRQPLAYPAVLRCANAPRNHQRKPLASTSTTKSTNGA
jgi:hypothetical protein